MISGNFDKFIDGIFLWWWCMVDNQWKTRNVSNK